MHFYRPTRFTASDAGHGKASVNTVDATPLSRGLANVARAIKISVTGSMLLPWPKLLFPPICRAASKRRQS
jgi:hypothetical protein